MVNHSSFFSNEIKFFLGEINYVRGCINQIQAVRPEMPTVRENGCWTSAENYIVCIFRNINSLKVVFQGLAYRPWYVYTEEPIYCFCDERDGCNSAIRSLTNYIFVLFLCLISFYGHSIVQNMIDSFFCKQILFFFLFHLSAHYDYYTFHFYLAD